MKHEEDWRIIHKLCFDRYKDVQKTPETYIFMTGKYKGKTYAYVAENHKKYIKWILDQDFKDDSPMHFIQGYCKKFTKQKHQCIDCGGSQTRKIKCPLCDKEMRKDSIRKHIIRKHKN